MPPPGKGFAGKLSKKSKAPKGGPRGRNLRRTQEFKKSDAGKEAIERGLRRALAGEGKSDVSKYDDKLAAAVRNVDFRNSKIGRSLLADQFKRGEITATDFARLQDIQQSPGDRTLEERRQINMALGLNPTAGMGILDSLKSGFQGEQFQQDLSRLKNIGKGIATISPVSNIFRNVLGLDPIKFDTTTASALGISPEEDARLRILSNPDIQALMFDNLDLGETTPTTPETMLDITPVRRPAQPRDVLAVSDTFSDTTGLPTDFQTFDIADPGMSNIVFGPDGQRYFGKVNESTGQMEYTAGADLVSMGPITPTNEFIGSNTRPGGFNPFEGIKGIRSLFEPSSNFTIGQNLK